MSGKDQWQRPRSGMNATQTMIDVLQQLQSAAQNDNPYLALNGVHGRTIWALVQRDWIVGSYEKQSKKKRLVNPMYRITGRGKKALKIFTAPTTNHRDGLCPSCRERPKHRYKSGNFAGYCYPCLRETWKRKWKLFGYQKDPDGLCPICQIRKRHITPSGNVRSYCLPCRRERSKETRKRRNQQLLERIQQGEVLLCYRCKERPRHIYNNTTVSDYCHECSKEYHREYEQRVKNSR